MKTRIITLILFFIMFQANHLFAEKQTIKLIFFNSLEKNFEFYSQIEEVMDEQHLFDSQKVFQSSFQGFSDTKTPEFLNIKDFKKTEKEVIENEIDTKTIYDQIIFETFYGK